MGQDGISIAIRQNVCTLLTLSITNRRRPRNINICVSLWQQIVHMEVLQTRIEWDAVVVVSY